MDYYNIKSLAKHYEVSIPTAWRWCRRKGFFSTRNIMGINVISSVQVDIVDEIGKELYSDLPMRKWPEMVHHYFESGGENGSSIFAQA